MSEINREGLRESKFTEGQKVKYNDPLKGEVIVGEIIAVIKQDPPAYRIRLESKWKNEVDEDGKAITNYPQDKNIEVGNVSENSITEIKE